jgi:membrane fusion protein (multidrug efflux system)
LNLLTRSLFCPLVLATSALIAGCGGDESAAAPELGATAGAPMGPGAVGVITESARDEEFVYELEALGTARANEAIEVTSKVSNLVTAIRFRDGQEVRRGAILVELDSIEATAELMAARAALSETQSQYQRSKELFATKALSQSQLDTLEATLRANEARVTTAQSRLSDTVIRARFDGRVGLRRVSVGSLVSPGTVITTLDDMRTIKLDFAVPETFVGLLREGLPVKATSVAYANREFTGTVTSIDSRLDPTTRSVTVRAAVPNPDGVLKPGMFLTVRLRQDTERVVMIPEHALVPEEGRQFVFVVEDGRALKREVSIGRRKPGRVEIVRGLAAGERVIVEGTQKVRDGGAVQEAQAPAREAAAS